MGARKMLRDQLNALTAKLLMDPGASLLYTFKSVSSDKKSATIWVSYSVTWFLLVMRWLIILQ